MKTADAARGRWFGILSQLGIDENYLRNKHGPCPMCGGADRFRFDDKRGDGTYFCGGCGAGDGMDLAMKWTGLPFKELAKKIDGMVGNIELSKPAPKVDPRIRLRKIQKQVKPLDGINPVTRYLRSRGLPMPECGVSYHPGLDYYEDGKKQGNYPAMVSLFRNAEGKPISYHVTHLTNEGVKANVSSVKKILTPTENMKGGAIALFSPSERLGIAEGVETALAAAKLHSVPVWASATALLMEAWEPPAICKEILIFGDNDKSFAGQKSAYVLANKLALAGYSVQVLIAPNVGDWCDEVAA